MAPVTTGPRQATGMSPSGSMRFTDMTSMPLADFAGLMPSASAVRRLLDAEGLRNGRAGDVGIQNGHFVTALVHLGGEQAGDEGLAHAALAGHDADHMLDVGALVGRKGAGASLGGAIAAAGDAAAGALVGTFFCHDSFFLFSSGRALRDQGSSQGIIAQTPRHPFDTSGFLNVVRTKDRPLRKTRAGA